MKSLKLGALILLCLPVCQACKEIKATHTVHIHHFSDGRYAYQNDDGLWMWLWYSNTINNTSSNYAYYTGSLTALRTSQNNVVARPGNVPNEEELSNDKVTVDEIDETTNGSLTIEEAPVESTSSVETQTAPSGSTASGETSSSSGGSDGGGSGGE